MAASHAVTESADKDFSMSQTSRRAVSVVGLAIILLTILPWVTLEATSMRGLSFTTGILAACIGLACVATTITAFAFARITTALMGVALVVLAFVLVKSELDRDLFENTLPTTLWFWFATFVAGLVLLALAFMQPQDLAAPGAAMALTIIVSSLALWAFGSNPVDAFTDMVNHAASINTQVDIWNRATPLYLSAIAASIGFRMNLFNIGVEGQYLIAALVAAHVGGVLSQAPWATIPGFLRLIVVFLVAMTVGAVWAGLAGLLNVTRGVNVVISTIMLNFIAVSGLMAWGVQAWQADLREGESLAASNLGTTPIDDSSVLPHITGLFDFAGDIRENNPVSGMLLIAAIVGIGYYVLLNRTTFGFDLRSSGINPFAARAGGVPPKRMILIAMLLSGAIAGLIGLVEVFEISKFRPNQIQGLGFGGIAVALLGRNSPAGMAFAALLFGFLDISAGILQQTETASQEIVKIMQGIVLLAAVIAYEIASRVKTRDEAKATAEALAVVAV